MAERHGEHETPLPDDALVEVDGGWVLVSDRFGNSHTGPGSITREQLEHLYFTGERP